MLKKTALERVITQVLQENLAPILSPMGFVFKPKEPAFVRRGVEVDVLLNVNVGNTAFYQDERGGLQMAVQFSALPGMPGFYKWYKKTFGADMMRFHKALAPWVTLMVPIVEENFQPADFYDPTPGQQFKSLVTDQFQRNSDLMPPVKVENFAQVLTAHILPVFQQLDSRQALIASPEIFASWKPLLHVYAGDAAQGQQAFRQLHVDTLADLADPTKSNMSVHYQRQLAELKSRYKILFNEEIEADGGSDALR